MHTLFEIINERLAERSLIMLETKILESSMVAALVSIKSIPIHGIQRCISLERVSDSFSEGRINVKSSKLLCSVGVAQSRVCCHQGETDSLGDADYKELRGVREEGSTGTCSSKKTTDAGR